MGILINMPTTKTAPMVHSQVLTTTDYFMFKSIDGNRNKNLLHINRLKKSMSERYLFTAIIVNEKHEIIDGQHRFDCIVDLQLPLHYIVCRGYGLNEVHILNQNSKTWNSDDYLTGYCNLGYKDYIRYQEFKQTYGLGHTECMSLLSGEARKTKVETFYSGQYKVTDYEGACATIEKIMMLEPYYAGVKRREFVFAMIALLKNKSFSFTEFLQKLKLQPTALQDCTTSSSYITLVEEIYNYRRREKVNLRFQY